MLVGIRKNMKNYLMPIYEKLKHFQLTLNHQYPAALRALGILMMMTYASM